MSEILKNIKKDSLYALKNKDMKKKQFLSTLISDIETTGITNNSRRDISDDDALKVIRKYIKTLENNKEIVGEDNPTFTEYQKEIDILNNYLPQQMSEEDLTKVIKDVIISLDDKSSKAIGIVMKHLNDNYKGRFDNKMASMIIKNEINN